MNQMTVVKQQLIIENVNSFDDALNQFLQNLGLPQEKVLVDVSERNKVINNFPDTIDIMNSDIVKKSLYLSKFIAACGVGLFDAALNFLWDETILNLRHKVSDFDFQYFIQNTISDSKRRESFKSDADLVNITDYELIDGCRKIGIISEIAYKHLDYIRDMRNWASAAHPNQAQLTGFNLLSWLEICIKEVISKNPESSAIEIKRLLHNIRTETLSETDVKPIIEALEHLPIESICSLLNVIFGMYTDNETPVNTRNNIRLISKKCWNMVPKEEKYKYGIKYKTFSVNADITRRDLAEQFLHVVDGNSFLTVEDLSIKISESLANLKNAHYAMNNFYNEPAYAKILNSYIPDNGKIPDSIRFEYVKTLILVRIGNGYGVSNSAIPYYNDMINKFQELELKEVTKLVLDEEINSRLKNHVSCASEFLNLANIFQTKASNQVTLGALNRIVSSTPQQLSGLNIDSRYKDILKGFEN